MRYLLADHRTCLSHNFLLGSGHVLSNGLARELGRFVAQLFDYFSVGGLYETIFIDSGIGSQRADKADVGAFRGFNRAYPAIVGMVHVADIESSPLSRETSRA